MKRNFLIYSLVLAFFAFANVANAQFDDLYYNESTDESFYAGNSDNDDSYYDDEFYDEDEYGYDDSEYDYEFEDNEYYYSSRIRRFHRNYRGFDYFSPIYVDPFYYDPFFAGNFFNPGASIYISFGNWNSWRNYRWQNPNAWFFGQSRWNRWGNNWGNSWGNNFFFGPTVNNFGGGWGYGNSFAGFNNYYNSWCAPGFAVNNNFNNANITPSQVVQNPNGTYYGSRRNNAAIGTSRATTPRTKEVSRRSYERQSPRTSSRNNSSKIYNSRRSATTRSSNGTSRRSSTRSATRSSNNRTSTRSTTRSSSNNGGFSSSRSSTRSSSTRSSSRGSSSRSSSPRRSPRT